MKNFLNLFLKTYLFTWTFCSITYAIIALLNNVNVKRIMTSFFNLVGSKRGLIILHSFFLLFILLALIAKYLYKTYKTKGLKNAFFVFCVKIAFPIFMIVFGVKFIVTYNNTEDFKYEWNYTIENKFNVSKQKFLRDQKFRGMNAYGIGRRNENLIIQQLVKNNIEWVAVIPYFYQENENSKSINIPNSIGIWSRRDSLLIKGIEKVKEKKLFVMLKPHLWMSSGWRSNINFKDSTEWDEWFANYRKITLHYAKMAQLTKSDLFCIGTELRSSLKAKPTEWLSLIKEVKSIYKGKLTYAANWDDDFEFTQFWNQMDYIGLQAYYPLTKKEKPNLLEIKEGWKPYVKKLREISKKLKKQILFTEVGYRPDIYATSKPWAWGSTFERLYKKKSDETQLLAYKALYEKLWNESWFAGTFPWEWNSGDFPIYKKPAQNIIAIWYAK